MKYSELPSDLSFFAAANSYNGFKSLFADIFNPCDFSKMLILKGGPGTGKSTILKRLILHAYERGCYTEAIYCSSDPKSLDGAIIKSEKGSIAILDGTAPHSCDPIFPGSIEEIVNLGIGFKTEKLESMRGEIVDATKLKSKCYSNAYASLKLAGDIYARIKSIISKSTTYSEAECIARALSEMSRKGNGALERSIYISAFCKDGYITRPLSRAEKKVVKISGSELSVKVVMRALYRELKSRECIEITCLSPLDSEDIETIVTNDCMYEICTDGNEGIDTLGVLPKITSEVQQLLQTHKSILELARSSFEKASDAHFELEKIYTSSMDFSVNDQTFSQICELIDKKL